MISFINSLLKLFALIVILSLVFTLPPIVNYFAPKFVNPFVRELFPEMGILSPQLTAKSYSFALPFGLKTKGFNLDFVYQYPDLEKAEYILSGDHFSVTINPIDSFYQKKLVLTIAFDGLLVKSKLLPEKSVTTSSYDYQKYMIRVGSIEREIELTPFFEFNSYRNKLKEAVLSWNKTPVDIEGELEISILGKRYGVPIRSIKDNEIEFDPLLLSDLSLAYRKPFLPTEITFMQKHPLSTLDLLNFKLTAEESAVLHYPLDIDALSKASTLLYHHQITSHLGLAASSSISDTEDVYVSPEYELASSMGRATVKKGITFENLSETALMNKLIKAN